MNIARFRLAANVNILLLPAAPSVSTVDSMDLDGRDIQEFIQLWKEELKETLTPADARQCASQLLELYALLASPLPDRRESVTDNISTYECHAIFPLLPKIQRR